MKKITIAGIMSAAILLPISSGEALENCEITQLEGVTEEQQNKAREILRHHRHTSTGVLILDPSVFGHKVYIQGDPKNPKGVIIDKLKGVGCGGFFPQPD